MIKTLNKYFNMKIPVCADIFHITTFGFHMIICKQFVDNGFAYIGFVSQQQID